ncbi:MAG: lysine--tRNA ligase [Oscillospiraceae bacterium]|nr:lysine--tRNA ligase [Oscillospiraceae bacterium]
MAQENKNVPVMDISEQKQIRIDKLKELQSRGKDPFEITRFEPTAYSEDIKANYEEYEGKTVTIAGRVMSKRIMGKAAFCHIQDKQGKMQVYVKREDVNTDPDAEITEYQDFKKWDIGDIVGITGFVFVTQTGEISVHAKELTLLSKALLPLPEKFHGLKDTDMRYRQRSVDLIINPDVKDVFVKRSKIITAIRRFLDNMDFLEVETPVLHTIAGGASARPFITHHNALDIDMYMRIALELHLKRLIIGGMDRVYEIGRVFRNEGIDVRHNPEFTLLELYQAYTDVHGMMDICENVIRYAAKEVLGTAVVTYGEHTIDLEKPFERISMIDCVKKYSGVDFNEIETTEQAKQIAKEKGVEFEDRHEKGDILALFFDEFCEEHLIQPTFLIDYPVEISPLAKRNPQNKAMTERFELFIVGREHANAFSELNYPIDQRERFENQVRLKELGDEEATDMDTDFLTAMEYGMPPTGGIGIGIDRLVMLLTNQHSIRDVLLFPTMKPVGAGKREEKAETAAPAAEVKAEEIDFSKVEIEPLFKDFVDFETFSKSDFRAVKIKDCVAVPKSKKLLQFTLDDGSGEDRTILSGIHEYYEPEQLIGKTAIAITNLPPRKMMGIDSCGMLISAVHAEEGEERLHLLMVDPHIPAGAKLY